MNFSQPFLIENLSGFIVVRGFSDRCPCLVAMSLGLLLFQGCALLQRPSDIAAPTETPAQPGDLKTSLAFESAPSQAVPVQPTAKKSSPVQATLPQTGEASFYGAQHQGKQTA